MLNQIMAFAAGCALIYFFWYVYKKGGLHFSSEDTWKTLSTLGGVALFLLLVIYVAIRYLRG